MKKLMFIGSIIIAQSLITVQAGHAGHSNKPIERDIETLMNLMPYQLTSKETIRVEAHFAQLERERSNKWKAGANERARLAKKAAREQQKREAVAIAKRKKLENDRYRSNDAVQLSNYFKMLDGLVQQCLITGVRACDNRILSLDGDEYTYNTELFYKIANDTRHFSGIGSVMVNTKINEFETKHDRLIKILVFSR